MLEWIVQSEESGDKLIAFLTKQLGNRYSTRFLKRAIENNRCQINQRTERFASILVGKGDLITLNLEGFASPRIQSVQFDRSRILYEDDSLFIYNKPAGITSDAHGIVSVLNTYHSGLQLVHRLDRETTGVLLLVKNSQAFEKMVQHFKAFNIQKSYIAIVDGIVAKKTGTIENYLGKKHLYEGQTIWGAVSQQKGVYACTEWIKIAQGQDASLLFCFPKTGRTHQIRVHLAGMGHPILGDFQYCKRFRCHYLPDRYLLHASEVKFPHPLTSRLIQIKAPLPEDFIRAQNKLFK